MKKNVVRNHLQIKQISALSCFANLQWHISRWKVIKTNRIQNTSVAQMLQPQEIQIKSDIETAAAIYHIVNSRVTSLNLFSYTHSNWF